VTKSFPVTKQQLKLVIEHNQHKWVGNQPKTINLQKMVRLFSVNRLLKSVVRHIRLEMLIFFHVGKWL
jgi:hypothetical protein